MKKQGIAYSYIRFSTPEQLKGDSLRRQLDATKQYCKKHDLKLDESLNLKDLGLSAYHGKHKTKGALGSFLTLVEQGKIEKGSVLVVENLDRLSREEILTALNQFTGIIQAGIKLVTIQDGMEYSQESITNNWSQLIISITYMARAHDESATKAKRLSSAWEAKRKLSINGKKLTAACPKWLVLSSDKMQFSLVPEICQAIELIYRKKLDGKGNDKIAREMNEDPNVYKPSISKRNKTGGWRGSYIMKLLYNNRALIGEFQPHKLINGKRVPVGDPIPDYYPIAIEKELFFAVQEFIKKNSTYIGQAGGRRGKALNLFPHVAKCGLCGAPMHFLNKGEGSKGGQYLRCDRSQRKVQDENGKIICNAKSIRYNEFLEVLFKDFEELDITEFITGYEEQQAKIDVLQKSIEAKRFQMTDAERKIDNLVTQLSDEDNASLGKVIKSKIEELQSIMHSFSNDIQNQENELAELKSNGRQLKQEVNQTKEIIKLLQTVKDEDEAYNIRLRVRSQIQKLCRVIKIYPLDKKYPKVEEIEPGIVRWTNSKFLEKIIIRFNGAFKVRVLQLQGYGELL